MGPASTDWRASSPMTPTQRLAAARALRAAAAALTRRPGDGATVGALFGLSKEEREEKRIARARRAVAKQLDLDIPEDELNPDIYRRKHGKCPRGFHYSEEQKHCTETTDEDLDVSDAALDRAAAKHLEKDDKAEEDVDVSDL